MHTLHPKTTKLKKDEVEKLLEKFNISLSQLPKIAKDDPGLKDAETGDVFMFERKTDKDTLEYFRVVV